MGNEISTTNTEDFESQALLALGARNPIVVEQTDDTVKYSSEDCSGDTNEINPVTLTEYEPGDEVISYPSKRDPNIRDCVSIVSLAKFVKHLQNFDGTSYPPELIAAIKQMIEDGTVNADFVPEQEFLTEWDAIRRWPEVNRYYDINYEQFESEYGTGRTNILSDILTTMGLAGTGQADTSMVTFVGVLTEAGPSYGPSLVGAIQEIKDRKMRNKRRLEILENVRNMPVILPIEYRLDYKNFDKTLQYLNVHGINYDFTELIAIYTKMNKNPYISILVEIGGMYTSDKYFEYKDIVASYPIVYTGPLDEDSINSFIDSNSDGKYNDNLHKYYDTALSFEFIQSGIREDNFDLTVTEIYLEAGKSFTRSVGIRYRQEILEPLREGELYNGVIDKYYDDPDNKDKLSTLSDRELWKDIIVYYIRNYGMDIMSRASCSDIKVMEFFDINYEYYRLLYDTDELEVFFKKMLEIVYHSNTLPPKDPFYTNKMTTKFINDFLKWDDNRTK